MSASEGFLIQQRGVEGNPFFANRMGLQWLDWCRIFHSTLGSNGRSPIRRNNQTPVPVAMPMSESYDALSKGVAQGIICPYEAMRGFRLAEVVNNSAEYGSAYVNANYIVMNKDKWNAIAPNDRKAIEEVNNEWIEKMGKLWDELDKDGKDYFVQKGGKVAQLSKEEGVAPFNSTWSDAIGTRWASGFLMPPELHRAASIRPESLQLKSLWVCGRSLQIWLPAILKLLPLRKPAR